MSDKRMIIFNGSPRKKGTSYSFARTITMLAEEAGHTAEIMHVIEYFDGEKDLVCLKERISQSDIVALVAPLYVDALPYPDIWLLETLSRDCRKELHRKSFFAIGQCGFPDITRCKPLLDSCRCFAEQTGMMWLGGLAYGGGAMLDGAHLEDLGKEGVKMTTAFRLALENVFQREEIYSKPQELLTVKIPKTLYRPLAAYLNHRSKKLGRKYGVKDLARKVYLE